MLNYFLLQLAGPQRRSLSVKDPEKYEFRPRQLLKQVSFMGTSSFVSSCFFFSLMLLLLCMARGKIAEIYVHIARGDKENIFPAAISKDGRSYNEKVLFRERTTCMTYDL